MLLEYVHTALRHARYEILDEGEGYYGEIPECQGVFANAQTLEAWRLRFEARWSDIAPLGYDERFRRMWRFYLCYCEGGFRERALSDVQILLAKPGYRGTPWRVRAR